MAVTMVAACKKDEHVRECEGGLEVRIILDDDVRSSATTVRVDVTVDGTTHTRDFDPASFSSDGTGAFVIRFENTDTILVDVTAEVRDGANELLASGAGQVMVPVATTGCSLLELDTRPSPGGDGGLPDGAPMFDDEDGDGIADEDDNCPGIHNVNQEDQDQDDIGDPCDPHPNDTTKWIDVREYFNGFNGPDVPEEIGLAAGTWSIDNGALVQSDVAGTGLAHYISPNDGSIYVETRITVTEHEGPGVAANGAGLRLGFGLGGGWWCMARYNAVQALRLLDPMYSLMATTPVSVTENTGYTMRFRLEDPELGPTDLNCKWDSTELSDTDGTHAVGNSVQLETLDAATRYDYLFIVHSSPAP